MIGIELTKQFFITYETCFSATTLISYWLLPSSVRSIKIYFVLKKEFLHVFYYFQMLTLIIMSDNSFLKKVNHGIHIFLQTWKTHDGRRSLLILVPVGQFFLHLVAIFRLIISECFIFGPRKILLVVRFLFIHISEWCALELKNIFVCHFSLPLWTEETYL